MISDILLAEFAEGIYKVVLRERHGNHRWQRYWTDGRARRRAARLLAAAGADDLATLDRGFGRVSETVLTLHTVNDRLAGMRSRRPRTR